MPALSGVVVVAVAVAVGQRLVLHPQAAMPCTVAVAVAVDTMVLLLTMAQKAEQVYSAARAVMVKLLQLSVGTVLLPVGVVAEQRRQSPVLVETGVVS
jgi:hypothetical protein